MADFDLRWASDLIEWIFVSKNQGRKSYILGLTLLLVGTYLGWKFVDPSWQWLILGMIVVSYVAIAFVNMVLLPDWLDAVRNGLEYIILGVQFSALQVFLFHLHL